MLERAATIASTVGLHARANPQARRWMPTACSGRCPSGLCVVDDKAAAVWLEVQFGVGV